MNPKHSRFTFFAFRMPILLALCALLGAVASAQGGHGTLSGRAVDRVGAVLAGARVKLQPGDIVTATDGQGEFNFIGLAPGDYTLTISYIGFTDFTKQVTVAAGKAGHIEAKLEVSAKSEEVTVVADRPHGEAEAINRQRTSDNILQVLPSDVITSLPNANIADAVGRLPSVTLERDEGEGKYVQIRGTEPRLNTVTIDGVLVPAPEDNVRQIKLDTIPADIVESVEINKTLSANQDADAIGGSVNLVTKSAGDQPTLILQGIGGFTPILNTRAIAQISGTIGQRFGTSKKFGALISGSYDYNGRGIDDIEASPNDTAIPSYGSMDVREYRYRRHRYGFGGGLDYKLGDGSGLYLHYFYSDFRDYGDKWKYTFNDGTGCTGDGTTSNPCPPEKFSGSERAPDYRIGTTAIGGKHIFSNSWLAWEISVAASLQTAAAGNPGFDFQYNGPVTTNGQSVGPPLCANIAPAPNPYLPQWTPGCDAAGGPYYTPSNWSLLDVNTTSGNTSQTNIQGAFSYATNYHLGKHNSTFEFGLKERNAHKGQNAYSPTYDNPPGATPLMTQYLSGFTNPNYYFNDYRLGPVVSWPSITASLPNLVSQGILPLDVGATHLASDASNFEYTERISAAYAMNTVEAGRFRLQLGFRFEATQLNTLGYKVAVDANGNWLPPTTPVPANYWYWNPLPSAQLRYRLTDDSDLRVSYGRGISRPNPYDTIPYVEINTFGTPAPTVSLGNSNLGPEHANNYDVLYEHYLKPYGEIQGGFFYKQLSAPIYYTQNLPTTGGSYPGYLTTTVINGTHAWLAGFEAAYIQHLGFLPRGWNGFGVSANYSWTTSNSGPLPGRPDTPALQRQAPSTWNISPTYDLGRFSSRVGLSYNGNSVFQYQWQQCTPQQNALGNCTDQANLGPKGPAGDVYFYPHLQLDAQASYRVRKQFTFIVQGLNLSNEVFGFYNGSKDYVNQREYYGRTYSFGLRWEPRREY
jgi:TonB-dependent receptor